MHYPDTIKKLISFFATLPGVGPRTAERYVFSLLNSNDETVFAFAQALVELKERVRYCTKCNCISEQVICQICEAKSRDYLVLCVVSDSRDMLTIESTGRFSGLYYSLGGAISLALGVDPQSLLSQKLVERISKESIKEVILAFSPNIEGETTAMYIHNLLKPLNVKVTRLARGLPMGSNLEYADDMTISNAFKYRNSL